MGKIKQNLDRSLIEYEKLQLQHILIMKNEAMPDLPAMIKQQDIAFSKLKRELNDFIEDNHTSETGSLLLEEFKTRIASIMELSDKLSGIAIKNRTRLKEGFKKMQQGKAAMKGYKNTITSL